MTPGALIMTHRDRAGDRFGHRAGRREAAANPGRKPWETVSMDHDQRAVVLGQRSSRPPTPGARGKRRSSRPAEPCKQPEFRPISENSTAREKILGMERQSARNTTQQPKFAG